MPALIAAGSRPVRNVAGLGVACLSVVGPATVAANKLGTGFALCHSQAP